MTKERVCANSPAMSRRTLMTLFPASGVAAALPFEAAVQRPEPLAHLFQEWKAARNAWRELAALPGNENWDDPRSVAAAAQEDAAEELMLQITPTTPEGFAVLAALAWAYIKPVVTDPDEFAAEAQSIECRAIAAIWRATSGQDGFPAI